jgi:tetratricopeptide (TPR) repeat protein
MSMVVPIDNPGIPDIEAAMEAGDRNLAIDLAIRALGHGLEHPLVCRLVADGLEEDGRPNDAIALLHRATVVTPGDVAAKLAFARMALRMDSPRDAVEALNDALAIDPDAFETRMVSGRVQWALRDLTASRAHYLKASEISQEEDEPLSALALIAARQGDNANARSWGERALALNPAAVWASIAVARADLAAGAANLAKVRLDRLLARSDLNDDDRGDALTYAADALDMLDRPAEAFNLYEARTAVLLRSRTQALAAGVAQRNHALANRLTTWFTTTPRTPWRSAPEDAGQSLLGERDHVFLLSFPRSGATLLEQVLASHPDVVALDESGALARAADHFLSSDSGLARLAVVSAAAADACREVYWRGVRESLGQDISGKVFVDKNPLNSVRLPVIAKLFPRARIIFAMRDPRDVVLSCFRRLSYSMMLEFFTLEGSARFYDAVMRLEEVYRTRLTLKIHRVRHEDLVGEFERTARKTLNFMGLDWDPSVATFATRAPIRSTTPSAAQVALGLNAAGVGQWRRYEAQLAPVMDILEPWAKRFGYPTGAVTRPSGKTAKPASPAPNLDAFVQQIEAATRGGDLALAFAEADRAVALGLSHPLFHRLRGVRAQQEGRLEAAITEFETALTLGGEDAAVLGALGLCLARTPGRARDGVLKLDRAIALNPGFAPHHYNRGWALESVNDLAGARAAYERAVSLDPNHAQSLANLAALAGRSGDWTKARALASRALALDPGLPVAATALAGAEAGDGDPKAAEQRLRALIIGGRATPHERAFALGVLGDVLDQQNLPADAFHAYGEAATLFKSLYAERLAAGAAETSLALATRLADTFAKADPAEWRRSPIRRESVETSGHLFLVGFPRSGTTMLGQAFASHGDVVTLDEGQTLTDAFRAFMREPDDLPPLTTIGEAEILRFRDAYWRRVRAAGCDTRGRYFVDKLPMNTMGLPLILKLFPEAKILFLRRDPRDVVLSTFRRRFAINVATVELLSLDGAARLYDAVMRLMEIYRSQLDLDLRDQGYETLVGDFEGETRAICAFAGLDWSPRMADFAGRASAVATPSSAQLARGLNSDGIGAWRRYKDQLEPVLPLLSPWVDRFGYARD